MSDFRSTSDRLVAAMSRPGFYPGPPTTVEHFETHISHVFVAGEEAYKIKKPVRFSFVDYSTLEQRYHFCREEIRLNRRLAPSAYLGVVPLYEHDGGWRIGTIDGAFDPRAAEYAVKMRRLDAARTLESLIRRGRLAPGVPERIAEVIARFHGAAERTEALVHGCAAAIDRGVGGNLDECEAFTGDLLSAADFGALRQFHRRFVDDHRSLLDERAREGRVCDGHGDLRCEHIYVGEEIEIVDCVEFSTALRYVDVASDLAFLLMDMERLGAPSQGHQLLRAYLRASRDPALSELLNFYKCYRAVVRGKVAALKSQQPGLPPAERERTRRNASERFAAALHYARLTAPAIIVICGLPGSGKSTIATILAERIGFVACNSDVVRKQMLGMAPGTFAGAGYREGIYQADTSRATYARLRDAASHELRRGRGVILDASFKDAAERALTRDLARRAHVPIVFAYCAAPEAEIARRLAARHQRPGSVSDATWDVYLRQKQEYAPFAP